MNDITFACELDNIKRQITSFGRHTAQATSEDMFSDDLSALKLRLQSMEASLSYLNSSHGRRETFDAPPRLVESAASPSLPFALPSGPVFWKLWDSLRTDVQGLNTRVADMEGNFSNLEDRVDGLDPSRFTPPASGSTNRPVPWTSDHYSTHFGQSAAELPCDFKQQQNIQQNSPAWWNRHVPQPESDFSNTAQYGAGVALWTEGSSGVAFRDREIARLEDILARMQTDAQDSEEQMTSKNNCIDELTYQKECLHNQIADLQQTVRAYNNIFAMNRREFENRQVHRHGEAQVKVLEREVQDLQDSFSRAVGHHRAELDEAVAEKENELYRLRAFAEAKDDVVRQQGDVIARGATIIEERDATIERLTKELKIALDDCRHETRERERASRLLEERTNEIAQREDTLARCSTPETPAGAPKAELATSRAASATQDEARTTPIKPLAFDAQQDLRQHSGQWTPQTLGKFAKLPHEKQRAAAWESVSAALGGVRSGQAGPSIRQSDGWKLPGKLALDHQGTTLPESAWPVRKPRYKLPLDAFEGINQESCAIPPTLPPRLSISHSDAEAGHSAGPTLTQSDMYDRKPKRSLQAYVEVEDNSEKHYDAA